jgi:hypothetical protein
MERVMFGSPMLDVAIGLIFFYLIISIIVTVLQEFIASFFRLRNKNLLKAVEELIGKVNRNDFFKHPLIFPLFKGKVTEKGPEGYGPAYIPSRNFALAILALEETARAQNRMPDGPAFTLARFFTSNATLGDRLNRFDATASALVDNIANPAVREAATGALKSAVGELKTATDVVDTAAKELENLFDSSMARAAGWYKRQAQWIALLISVLLAAALNADSIYVGQRLWEDEALRNQAVAAAEAFYENPGRQEQLTLLCTAKETAAEPDAGEDAAEPGATAGTQQLTLEQWGKVRECTEREIKGAMDQLTGYPIGWRGWNGLLPVGQPGQNLFWAVLGIFLTGLAVSLGSSFWFDLLGKFMNVRMTGKQEKTATPPPEGPGGGEASGAGSEAR